MRKITPLEQRIITTIALSDSPISSMEILSKVKCKTSDLYLSLKMLVRCNFIRATGIGVKGKPILYSIFSDKSANRSADIPTEDCEVVEYYF